MSLLSARSQLYLRELQSAIATLLPHQGLSLCATQQRLRWTDRLLTIVALLMAVVSEQTLIDRFHAARRIQLWMYPSRRRTGRSYRGFIKRLITRGEHLLSVITPHLRRLLEQQARRCDCWQNFGFAVFGVDSTTLACPRTQANQQQLGTTGTDDASVQVLLTTIFHVGSNVMWAFVRGAARAGERAGLLDMLQLLPGGSLLLADAGFVGYAFFAAVIQNRRHLLVRCGSHLQFLRNLDAHATLHGDIVYLWPGKRRKKCQPPIVLRLLIVTDSRNHRIGLLTSVLDRHQLSDEQIIQLYKMRWSVELKYRTLKQVMNRRRLLSDSPAAAAVEADFSILALWMLEQMHFNTTGQVRRSMAAVLRAVRSCINGTSHQPFSTALTQACPDPYTRTGSKTRGHWPQRKRPKPQNPPTARMATRKQVLLAQRINQVIIAA